eukprot:TRINITY_DN10813_c0_g1_i6.p1 TRINITY_DN10813_c0_g1~~TRINITY_DN10813_c0_g1_i6.p1  ORF type:complete len:688 (+),score=123.80 TRINITY_DN10813_c0_g1_i6:283-2346(+)
MKQFDHALVQFRNQLSIAKKLGDDLSASYAFANLASSCAKMKSHGKALDCELKRLAYAKKACNKKAIALALDSVGQYYHRLAKDCSIADGAAVNDEKFNSSIYYYRKNVAKQDKKSDPSGIAHAAAHLGQSCERAGNYGRALKFYQQCLAVAEKGEDDQELGRALSKLGNVSRAMGDYTKAIEYYQRDLELNKAGGDRYNEAVSHSNLGSAFQAFGDYRQSCHHHEQHLSIMKELSKESGLPASHDNLGRIYEHVGDFRQAADHYKASLSYAQDTGDAILERASRKHLMRVTTLLEQGKRVLKLEDSADTNAGPMAPKALLRGSVRARQMSKFIRNSFRRSKAIGAEPWNDLHEVEMADIAVQSTQDRQIGSTRLRSKTANSAGRRSVLSMFGDHRLTNKGSRKASADSGRQSPSLFRRNKGRAKKSSLQDAAQPRYSTTDLDDLTVPSLVEALGDIDRLVTPDSSPKSERSTVAEAVVQASASIPTDGEENVKAVPAQTVGAEPLAKHSSSSAGRTISFNATALQQTSSKAVPRASSRLRQVEQVVNPDFDEDSVVLRRKSKRESGARNAAEPRRSLVLDESGVLSEEALASIAPAEAAVAKPRASPNTKRAWQEDKGQEKRFIALYNHNKDDDDELLTFKKGDRLVGMKRVNDGWYFGQLEGTDQTGLIPFNYVELEHRMIESEL